MNKLDVTPHNSKLGSDPSEIVPYPTLFHPMIDIVVLRSVYVQISPPMTHSNSIDLD